MTITETALQTYLHRHVAPTAWHIALPDQGFSRGTRFIARSAQGTVFLKLGSDERLLQVLSDARLTPRLLAGGRLDDTRITVQEFVSGWHPTRAWYAANAAVWAERMQILHQLPGVRDYLPARPDETYRTLLASYVDQIKAMYVPSNVAAHEQALVERVLAGVQERIPFVQGAGLVPIHGDPNAGNILITPSDVYLIDWDTVHLSEPMRDVAVALWWMYPPVLWPLLLQRFGIDLNDPAQHERFYLYITLWALEVALFFANQQQPALKQRFLRDAYQAYLRHPPDELLVS